MRTVMELLFVLLATLQALLYAVRVDMRAIINANALNRSAALTERHGSIRYLSTTLNIAVTRNPIQSPHR